MISKIRYIISKKSNVTLFRIIIILDYWSYCSTLYSRLCKITNFTNVILWGSKSLLIIDQKGREVARCYRRVLSKNATIEGRGGSIFRGGVWSSCCILGQQNHNWLSAKKVQMIHIIISAFWEYEKFKWCTRVYRKNTWNSTQKSENQGVEWP